METQPFALAAMLGLFIVALPFVLYEKRDEISPLAAFCMAALLAAMVGMAAGTVRWTRVTLSKATGRIEFDVKALVGGGKRVFALRDLLEARADVLDDSDGRTSRLLFAFDDAMADAIDPVERAGMERLRRRGLRRARLTDIPLTVYYSGGDAAERLAAEINAWLKG